MAKTCIPQSDDALFMAIARRYLLVETLTVQGRDHLDFHSISVTGIRKALAAAYEAGRESSGTTQPPGGSPPPDTHRTHD